MIFLISGKFRRKKSPAVHGNEDPPPEYPCHTSGMGICNLALDHHPQSLDSPDGSGSHLHHPYPYHHHCGSCRCEDLVACTNFHPFTSPSPLHKSPLSDHHRHLSSSSDLSSSSICDIPSTSDVSSEAASCTPSSSSSFSVRNRTLLSAWRRMKRVRGVGILCALGSVTFWSSNGLLIKLNQSNHNIHALETLTISSAIVSLVYLCFIFSCYGKRSCTAVPATPSTCSTSSTTTIDSSATEKSLTSSHSSANETFTLVCDWSIILGVPGERLALVMRCLLGTISLACFYCSYRYIPLSDATTLRFTSPVFIAIFAHFLVQEPFGLLQVVNSCTTLAGVVLIGRPSFLFASIGSGGSSSNLTQSTPSVNTSSFSSSTFVPTVTTTSSVIKRYNPHVSWNVTPSMDDTTAEAISDAEGSSGPLIQPMSSSLYNFYTHFSNNHTSESPLLLNHLRTGASYDQFKDTLFGVALALIAAITISISMIFMRRMKKTPAPLVIFWFSLSNVILGMAGLTVLGAFKMPTGWHCWLLIALTTLCSGLDQLFITLALKLENAGAVAVIQALCVVLSFLFSTLILHEQLYWTSALGGSFIFASVIVLGLAKMFAELKPTTYGSLSCSSSRKRIFQINLIQHCSSSLSLKSKSFDIINTHATTSQTTAKGDKQFSSSDPNLTTQKVPPSPTTTLGPNTEHSFLYQCPVNEPYLLRMAPICPDSFYYTNLEQPPHGTTSVNDDEEDKAEPLESPEDDGIDNNNNERF